MSYAAAWPQMWSDLESTRRGARVFLDNLDQICGTKSLQHWVAKWTEVGDAQCLLCDLNLKQGALAQAAQAWLSALTAFEVARRLVDEDHQENKNILLKVDLGIQKFGLCLSRKVERVEVAYFGRTKFDAYYLPSVDGSERVPAVICVSREEEAGATLLGRLLPVVIGRGISVLVVSHHDFSYQSRGRSGSFLSCCLDYLSGRPDVDAARIGVFGEGLSAVLATDFAMRDLRVAAAVCDGGLWNWARTLASISWMTGTIDVVDEEVMSERRLRMARRLRCPVLVVAGGRGIVNVSEAIKLQVDSAAACIDLELAVSRVTQTAVGEIENFVTSDDRIFGWLEQKLAGVYRPNHRRPAQE